jgi:plastocyanin
MARVSFLRPAVLAGIVGASVALAPGLAAGATTPVAAQAGGFNEPLAVGFNSFYPRHLVVEQGSSVKFAVLGFHTVTFPKKGTQPVAFVVPGSALNPVTNDPAGQPYWWGGATPALGINPLAAAPSGGTKVTGAKTVSSGFLGGRNPSFTVSFPKLGTFQVRCLVHARMRGQVTVVPEGSAAADSAAEVASKSARDQAADLAAAKATAKAAKKRTATQAVVIGPGNARQEAFAFFPKKSTVPTGGTLTFRMAGANEVHTVSFGPSAFLDKVGKRTFEGQGLALDPEGAYASDPPAATPVLTPVLHGNGFLNSGILTEPGGPGTHSFTVTFSTPGVYTYRCMIHSDMRGQVTVG